MNHFSPSRTVSEILGPPAQGYFQEFEDGGCRKIPGDCRRKIRAKREKFFFTSPRRGVITPPKRGFVSSRYTPPNGVSFRNCSGIVVYIPPQRGVGTFKGIYVCIHFFARRRRNFFTASVTIVRI